MNACGSGELTREGHQFRLRVYYEDTDFSGRVYHPRFIQYMERGRSEFLRLLGYHHRGLAEENLLFTVYDLKISYQKPAFIDDLLTVTTLPSVIGGARFIFRQSVCRDADILAQARVTIALIGAEGKPKRIPADLREKFTTSIQTP